jgi:hypothetical protein
MTVMDFAPVPERTLQQRQDALAVANRIRVHRARLKEDIKEGRVSVRQVRQMIHEPGVMVESMKVGELLGALPKFGPVKVNRMLRVCEIAPSKSLGGLTRRQRNALFERLWRYDQVRG